MPYIAPEVITEAKRMDLLTYLREYEPGELVKFSSNTYTTRTHDSLKISNGKWMWWSRGDVYKRQEQMKAEDMMKWVRLMNNIRNSAQEIVKNQVIFA